MSTMLSIFAVIVPHIWARSLDSLTATDYPMKVDKLPSACNNLENGYHWIRPMADDEAYPNIYVKCVDGYTMLDPSLMDFFNYHNWHNIIGRF